jgi:hypothetical protein
MRFRSIATLMIGLALPLQAVADEIKTATLYKNPQCGCCEKYADYLRQHGYSVTVKPSFDLSLINEQAGVPKALEGCHTTMVGGYVVEGHVTAELIDRLLTEKPNIRGISLPGMPMGSPGMEGAKAGPLEVYELPQDVKADEGFKVYGVE